MCARSVLPSAATCDAPLRLAANRAAKSAAWRASASAFATLRCNVARSRFLPFAFLLRDLRGDVLEALGVWAGFTCRAPGTQCLEQLAPLASSRLAQQRVSLPPYLQSPARYLPYGLHRPAPVPIDSTLPSAHVRHIVRVATVGLPADLNAVGFCLAPNLKPGCELHVSGQ